MKVRPAAYKRHPLRWTLVLVTCWSLLAGPGVLQAGSVLAFDSEAYQVLALVIGNNRHLEDPTRTLRYADDDALRVARTLQTLFPDSRRALLVDPDDETGHTCSAQTSDGTAFNGTAFDGTAFNGRAGGCEATGPPTLQGLEQAISILAQAARAYPTRPSKLLVYFSGHGEPGGTLHLADGYLSAERLKTALARVGAGQIFALTDACFSAGIMARGAGKSQGIPPASRLFPQEKDIVLPKTPDWLGVIAASSSTPEVASLRGGLLTFTALGGLVGPADLSGDGVLTFFEWGRYIRMQLERSPEAGDIQIRPLARDPLASVLTFQTLGVPTLVIEPTYPTGLIQVTHMDGKALVLQHFHTRGQASRFFLPPGAYDLRQLQQTHPDAAALREGLRAYPIRQHTLTLTVGQTLHLDGRSSPKAAWLVVGNRRGTESMPDQAPILPIGFDDERLFAGYGLERRYGLERPTYWAGLRAAPQLPKSHWSLVLRADPPWGGLKLSAKPMTLTPGFGIRLARQRALKLQDRWLLSGSLQAGYGLTFQPDACCDPDALEQTTDALTHRVRLGLGLSQTWVGPYWRLLMETRLSYAPQVSTTGVREGLRVLGDPVRPLDGAHLSTHRAFQWVQGEGEVALAMLFPLTYRWEVGPALQLLGVAGRLPGRDYTVPMLTVGLELRPATIR